MIEYIYSMGVWETYLPLLCFIFCPFLSDMTSFLTQFRLTTPSASGENWGQLILQPNHAGLGSSLFGISSNCVLWRGRRKRRRSFELAKRLESTNSLCSTRPPTDWPNLNTRATLHLCNIVTRLFIYFFSCPRWNYSREKCIKIQSYKACC